jgi:hypothetical protein
MDMNSVVEHGITGAGVALLFLGIGWAWQILGYPIRRILGYLNQMLFITDLPAPKRFGSINGHQAFKEQRTRVGSLLGFCLFAFLGASVALMMPQTVQADSNGRNDSDARNSDGGNALWPSAGQNLNNTRFQGAEHGIGVENASTLAVKWQFTTMGDVSATPAVDDDKVYFPDWGGYLYAVNRKTGAQVWQTKIEWQTGVAGDKARATPAVAGNKVIVGAAASCSPTTRTPARCYGKPRSTPTSRRPLPSRRASMAIPYTWVSPLWKKAWRRSFPAMCAAVSEAV